MLWLPIGVHVIPNLTQLGATSILPTISSSCGIVAGSTASKVWNSTRRLGESTLHDAGSIIGAVTWVNTDGVQPTKSRESAVVHDGCLEEVNYVGVVGVERTVARLVECGVACGVFLTSC